MHAHVDTETESARQIKRLMQQLVSARQAILQMHQVALQKDNDSDHTSDGLVGSLEEAAREHYAQMGGAVCSHMNETRRILMRSNLCNEALQAQMGECKDMRLQVERMQSDAKNSDAHRQALVGEVEAAGSKICMLKERLAAADQDVKRSHDECTSIKAELDSRTRSYKESISEMVTLRADLESKNSREVARVESALKERSSAIQLLSGELEEATVCVLETQQRLKVAVLHADAHARENSISEATQAQMARDLDQSRDELSQRDDVMKDLRKEIQQLKGTCAIQLEKISTAQRQLANLEQMLVRSKEEEAKLIEEKQTLQRDLPRLKTDVLHLGAGFKDKAVEYSATIRVFEDQLRVSMEEATRLCTIDTQLAEVTARAKVARERISLLEREHCDATSELTQALQLARSQLRRVQVAHDLAVGDLNTTANELATEKLQRQQVKILKSQPYTHFAYSI